MAIIAKQMTITFNHWLFARYGTPFTLRFRGTGGRDVGAYSRGISITMIWMHSLMLVLDVFSIGIIECVTYCMNCCALEVRARLQK